MWLLGCACRKLPWGQCCALVLHQPCRAEEVWAVGSQRKVGPSGVCPSRLDAWLYQEDQGKLFKSLFIEWESHTSSYNRFPFFPQRDEVDAVSLDATHSFIAGKCGLIPVVTEYYGKTLVVLYSERTKKKKSKQLPVVYLTLTVFNINVSFCWLAHFKAKNSTFFFFL